jgi:hypothetical protein
MNPPGTDAMDVFRERARDGWHRDGSGEDGGDDHNRGWPRQKTTGLVDP